MLLGKTAKFETYHGVNNKLTMEHGEIIGIRENTVLIQTKCGSLHNRNLKEIVIDEIFQKIRRS